MESIKKLCGDVIAEEELKQLVNQCNGNMSSVIEKVVSKLVEQEKVKTDQELKLLESQKNVMPENIVKTNREEEKVLEEKNMIEKKQSTLKMEEEQLQVGEVKPGLNLQGYCNNKKECLAAQSSFLMWINMKYESISLNGKENTNKKTFECPNCKEKTIEIIEKVALSNAEYEINSGDSNGDGVNVNVKGNQYQYDFKIQTNVKYEIKAKKIKQHCNDLDDLIGRSEKAMNSIEMTQLIGELQKHKINIVKPQLKKKKNKKIKRKKRKR